MKDHFSRRAEGYAKYRPGYPGQLIDFLLRHVEGRSAAWDCATGNGQTAAMLSPHFTEVFATDISERQLAAAVQRENLHYSVQPAEKTGFSSGYFDLITISQALHWFDLELFYKEATRVAREQAIIAAWSYSLLTISPSIDPLVRRFYSDTLGPYWDRERKYVDEEYQTIPFPFSPISVPAFAIEVQWSLAELSGYLSTWSAVQKYIDKHATDPVPELVREIGALGEAGPFRIVFPLHVRMGRIEK